MLINSFFSLAVAALLGLVIMRSRYDRVLSLLLAILSCCLFVSMLTHLQLKEFSNDIFPWIQDKNLHINVSLSSSKMTFSNILPLTLIAILTMFSNSFYNSENTKLRINSLLSLNLAAFILLICAGDFIQLIVSSSIITVLGFYIINKFEAKKKYIFYNLLADMALFTVFAIIYGCLNTVGLDKLSNYQKVGNHKDLVAILLLLSLFAKSGLFLFQNQLLDFGRLNFNRILFLSFNSTPLAALIILGKTHELLAISDYVQPLLLAVVAASVLWALIGCLIIDNIKEKALYLNMMFYAFSFYVVANNYASSLLITSHMVIAAYLLNIPLLWANVAASDEVYISKMGGFIHHLKLTFIFSLLVLWAYFSTVLNVVLPFDKQVAWLSIGLVVVCYSHILRQIYFGPANADSRVMALLKNNHIGMVFPVVIITLLVIEAENGFTNIDNAYIFIALAVLMFLGLTRFFNRLCDIGFIQGSDYFEKIYQFFILAPIRILGRILWLTIDFLFIERTIVNSLQHSVNFTIIILQKLQSPGVLRYAGFSILGLGIVLYYLLRSRL